MNHKVFGALKCYLLKQYVMNKVYILTRKEEVVVKCEIRVVRDEILESLAKIIGK